MPGGVRQRAAAVHRYQKRHTRLERAHRANACEVVVLTIEGDLFTVEQAPHDLDGLCETRLAHRRQIEPNTDNGVFREGMTGADAELQAAAAELVDGCQLARQVDRVPEVVVQDQRTE